MEGATHFIEQYRHDATNSTFSKILPISELDRFIRAGKTLFSGYKTIAIFLIKPKPTNEQ